MTALPLYVQGLDEFPELAHDLPPEFARLAYHRWVFCMDCEQPAHAIFLANQKRRYVHDGTEFYIMCPGSIYFVCPVCSLDWSDICGNYLDQQDIINKGIANILRR